MTFSWDNDLFVERLQQCSCGPWTLFEAQHHLDALVLQPHPQTSDELTSFVHFMEKTFHRRLVQCFVGGMVSRMWTMEQLQKQTRPPSPQALSFALEQCCVWDIARESPMAHSWHGHPRLALLNNLGWTFEWVIQKLLERDYSALVRRHVILGEMADQGEIDILALLDHQSLLIECKSSSKNLTDRQLDRFVAKGRSFPADWALLIVDTDDPHRMQQRLGQLGQAMWRASGDASVGAIRHSANSSIVCLRDNLYVADTGGGISATLRAILTDTFE